MSFPIIASIDVGFGHTKFAVRNNASSKVVCDSFPSLVTGGSESLLLSDGIDRRRDTRLVQVNSQWFEVGKEINAALPATHERPLFDEYCKTDEHLALLRGALSYINKSTIDILVLGLPVNAMEPYQESLRNIALGTHTVGDNMTVEVKQVMVIAQPVGGFIDQMAINPGFINSANHRTLILDPGYYTLDWLTLIGRNTNEKQSGSIDLGVSELIRFIATTITKRLGVSHYSNYERIEEGLIGLHERKFSVQGETFDLLEILDKADAIYVNALNAIENKIEKLDIDSILLVGGGAGLYHEIVKKRFSRIPITISPNTRFANVRGYQRLGERLAKRALNVTAGAA